ncbi:hypothetical protein ACFSUD_11940 [Sulfitobacter aestuarii]|uniref:LysM domain-containing protein n=1 Tax=Sulfitobacter aestuarii TaxID=2161676 RepID=A0ABW5U4M5_9RHOB
MVMLDLPIREADAEDLASALYPWEDLLILKPTKSQRAHLWRKTVGGHFQFIEDGRGDLSCDLYAVKITRLPKIGGERVTAPGLLRHLRLNINDFIDRRNTQFRPYGFDAKTRRGNRLRWRASRPDMALIHIDMLNLAGGAGIEDATVMAIRSSPLHWVFGTVFTPKLLRAGNGSHPINGNREFRLRDNGDGTYTFYTRAADRVNGLLEAGASLLGLVSRGQDALWRSLQRGLADFVNRNGGRASIRKPLVQKFDWPRVHGYLSARYCTVEMDSEAEDHERGCIRVSGKTGKLYRIRRGDTLLGLAGRAYNVRPGSERQRLAQMINAHPFNQRFWRASGISKSFPQGRISFQPRFSCDAQRQITVRRGAAPFGRCYARILLPPKPG